MGPFGSSPRFPPERVCDQPAHGRSQYLIVSDRTGTPRADNVREITDRLIVQAVRWPDSAR